MATRRFRLHASAGSQVIDGFLELNEDTGHAYIEGLASDSEAATKDVSPSTFTIHESAPVADVAVPAALAAPDVFGDLDAARTYCITLQTQINTLEGNMRKILDVLTASGQVLEA